MGQVFLVPELSAEEPPKPEEAGHDDPYAGLRLRINSDDNQSEIQVVLLPPNMVRIGFVLGCVTPEGGDHPRLIDFIQE